MSLPFRLPPRCSPTATRCPDRREQRKDVGAIKSASQEMMRLMNNILSFAQLESGRVAVRIAPVAVHDAIDRAESLVRPRIQERGLTFERKDCSENLSIAADADRLQQILLNLLTNAIKFTAPEGRISIACEPSPPDLRIHVHDTGIGIPPDRLGDIFEPFVQIEGDPGAHGVGLGLAISRDLARAMGGDLAASSAVGRGSTFTITLPMV